MRLIAILPGLVLGLLLAGCDRQKADVPQGGGAPSDWAGPRDAVPQAAQEPVQEGGQEPGRKTAGKLDRSHAGTAAPAVDFQSPEGTPVSLADFRGKPLLVNLWATWCAPCIAEMPTLDALAARDKSIRVLAVSQDMDGAAKVDPFFAERKFSSLQPYLDPEIALMSELRVDTLPTTILYDAEGKEVWRMTGMADWTGAETGKLLREAS